ncbi:MAG: ribonuclease [Planctomycetes bacterium DG_20]|nr:MAG: ribonuclease [Planctomycetes bacterium DG_20]
MTSLIPLALAPELIGAIALFAVSVAGVAVAAIVLSKRTRVARSGTEQVLAQATKEAEALVKEAKVEAKAEAIRAREAFEKDATKTREELRERERLVVKREDTLDSKMETLAAKEKTVEAAERRVSGLEKAWNKRKAELDQMVEEEKRQLFKISGLGPNEARTVLLERMEAEVQHEVAALIQRATERAQETADQRAREILAATVQRLASDYTSEATVATVDIPSDEMKGRIIGREGRNIRAFERVTGVDVIVDDTPGVVVLSSFDPVRREIARRSLAKLITDGRIQPPRIEQIVSECRKDVEHEMNETGKQVALDTGVKGLHPKEVQLLGRLKFRTSYGQSVLQHSIEVSALAGMLAEELGLDGQLARRAGLLHDIGKAVDHEVQGGHPEIGADLARRYNETAQVVHAIGKHHEPDIQGMLYTTIVSAADAVSASRPGARRETLEKYVQRLEKLEGIACRFEGVESAFAIQAGREGRVIVDADKVDDQLAMKVCRDIAKAVEDELTYPGEVRVMLIRERRIVEYAR